MTNEAFNERVARDAERLCDLHSRMLAAVQKQRPYPVRLTLGQSDLDTVLYAAVTLEQVKAAIEALQPDGYADAFYEVAAMLGLPAQTSSPREVWEQQMRPRLMEALQPPEPIQDGWRPIETAPKDGTHVLLAPSMTVGFWDLEFKPVWREDLDGLAYEAAWTDLTVGSFNYEEYAELSPTHWMPLPAAPDICGGGK